MKKLSDYKLNDSNPRNISAQKLDKLKKSIQSLPQMMEVRPIVVDADGVVLGGNMRYRALRELGYYEVPDDWVQKLEDLTEEQKKEFTIKDNVGFGVWDWDILANEWDSDELEDWGLDLPGFAISDEEYGEDFSLPDGDKEPFQQMTFTLADDQAEFIKTALSDVKKLDEFKYIETFANENSNGNALYLIISQWEEQRK